MKNKKIVVMIYFILLVSVLFSIKVSAGFALGFPYEIKGNPGETHRETISLQNKIEPISDITIEIVIKEGGEYLSFPEGKIIEISANETKNIPLDIIIPANSKPGQSFDVSLQFKQVGGGSQSQGTIGLSLAISKDFKIKVEGEPSNTKAIILSSVLALITLILIIIMFRMLRKKKN